MTSSEKSARNYGIVAAASFFGLVLLILLLFSLTSAIPERTPPDGIDIVTEIQTLGGGAPSGGGNPAPPTQSTGGQQSGHVATTNNTQSTQTSAPNTNSNNNKGTDWNDAWSNSSNTTSNSTGPGSGGGNGGDGPGGDGLGGSGNCKGCRGSGTGLGNGDAMRLVVPKVNNQDEGVIVVKVKVDKNGKVIEAKEYGQPGTYGNLSEQSYREAKRSALETQFKPEPNTNDYRTGEIRYNFRPN